MDKFLNEMRHLDNLTLTENGAVALSSTYNKLLDAFGTLGAMRTRDEKDIIDTYRLALSEDKELAFKMLFYLRDIRGIGLGERRIFRVLLREMAISYPDFVRKNIDNIPYYGRYDDLLVLIGTALEKDVVNYIKTTLQEDIKSLSNNNAVSNLAKWLPSINTSSQSTKAIARKLIKLLGLNERQYRKMLSGLRKHINIVERLMSAGKWDEIKFEVVPSKAGLKYSNAFLKRQETRYMSYLKDVLTGDKKINASVLNPVDIVGDILKKDSFTPQVRLVKDIYWNNIPNYFEETDRVENGLCVVDVSGSMYGKPMEVAISLGLYCAEKSKGRFKDHFITFSSSPKLQKVQGDTIVEKVQNLKRADWGGNTNLEGVFDLILATAIESNCTQEEIPNKLYVITDMQMNYAIGGRQFETFSETMERKYNEHGYELPQLVWWNVDARDNAFQNTANETGYCLVSGYSPTMFKAVLLGTEYEEIVDEDGNTTVVEKLDPITVMLSTLNNERYDRVVIV